MVRTSPLSPQLESGMITCHTEIRSGVNWSRSESVCVVEFIKSLVDVHWIPELPCSIHGESVSSLACQENLRFLLSPFRLQSSVLLLCSTKDRRTSRPPKGNHHISDLSARSHQNPRCRPVHASTPTPTLSLLPALLRAHSKSPESHKGMSRVRPH